MKREETGEKKENKKRESPAARQRWDDDGGYEDGPQHRGSTYARPGQPGGEPCARSGPHAGKGPKSYKRSDAQVCDEVCHRLAAHGAIDATDIEVRCADGIVTLIGHVADAEARRLAEDCAETVYGVHGVSNEIRIEDRR